jgi:putative phosphoribosyl transferase
MAMIENTPESAETRGDPQIREVRIGPARLEGMLGLPFGPRGVVVFAHGSGSGRLSPRNNYVADALGQGGLATLLFDLLTEEESADRPNVFDINLLASRLLMARKWVGGDAKTSDLPVGYFGASTGAAAALIAAATSPEGIEAVVSRGGRPDMAGPALAQVCAPTRLIVGSLDVEVLELNRSALGQLRCEKDLQIVPGASHLFEEPGTLDAVIELARNWFTEHFVR